MPGEDVLGGVVLHCDNCDRGYPMGYPGFNYCGTCKRPHCPECGHVLNKKNLRMPGSDDAPPDHLGRDPRL